jgi:predicted SnoaL-like aldol condensation-catalyzing enzyme
MKRSTAAAFVLALIGCTGVRAEAVPAVACEPSAEASRDLVVAFYTQALIDKQPQAAFEAHVSTDFVEHKPAVPSGGRAAVADFLAGLIKQLPDARWEILRTVAERDFVVLHVRFTPAPGAPPYAIADLFRIENCTIVEHWDVVEPPRDAKPAATSNS